MVFTHVVPRFLSLSQNRGVKFKEQIYNLLEYFRFLREALNFQTIFFCTAQTARTTKKKKIPSCTLKGSLTRDFRIHFSRSDFTNDI
jgi:hypothetical protein